MAPQRPGSVTGAIWILTGVLAVTGVTALLTLVLHDELVDAWAAGRSDAGSVEPPAFVPVALTMFVVVALLTTVLMVFFTQGHNWARVLLSAIVVLLALATVATLRTDPPVLFVVLSCVSLVGDLAAFLWLWRRDSRAWTGDPWTGSRSPS